MEDTDQTLKNRYVESIRISPACKVFCVILAFVFGVLAILPTSVTQLFRPAFIAACLFALKNNWYYKLGATKWHIISLVYYTVILFSFAITSATVSAYISIALYITFFVLASNRVWTKKEIKVIFVIITVACTAQAIITIACNPGMLTGDGSSHIRFLGTVINRNTIAFGTVPGVSCGLILFLYDRPKRNRLKSVFYMLCFSVCTAVVFVIACRSAFLAAVGGAACVVWQNTREDGNKRGRVKRKILTIILAFGVLFLMMYVSENTISSRLFDFGEASNDSGRDVLWEEAWELIDEKPVFGGGFDYWESTGHKMGTHNSFLTIMVSTGWTGGILLVLFFAMALIEMLKTRNLVPFAFMAEVLLHSWTEPGMDYFAYIPLTMAFIVTRYLQHQNKTLITVFT